MSASIPARAGRTQRSCLWASRTFQGDTHAPSTASRTLEERAPEAVDGGVTYQNKAQGQLSRQPRPKHSKNEPSKRSAHEQPGFGKINRVPNTRRTSPWSDQSTLPKSSPQTAQSASPKTLEERALEDVGCLAWGGCSATARRKCELTRARRPFRRVASLVSSSFLPAHLGTTMSFRRVPSQVGRQHCSRRME